MYFRLIAAPVHIEVHEKTTSSAFSITACLTAAKCILLECLYDPFQSIPILMFDDSKNSNNSLSITKPNLKVTVKHIEKSSKHMSPRRNCLPKTEIR